MYQVQKDPKQCYVFIPPVYPNRGNLVCCPGKARPRVGSRGTYLPQAYTDWKIRAIQEMVLDIPKGVKFREYLFPYSWLQMAECKTKGAIQTLQKRYGMTPTGIAPCTALAIKVVFVGARVADVDNAIGSILDLLVNAELLEDDAPRYLREIGAVYQDGGKAGCHIYVTRFNEDQV